MYLIDNISLSDVFFSSENELTNESGIIKIEIQKGDKVVTASMHLAEYSMIKFLHNIHLGDDMIDSLINELKD